MLKASSLNVYVQSADKILFYHSVKQVCTDHNFVTHAWPVPVKHCSPFHHDECQHSYERSLLTVTHSISWRCASNWLSWHAERKYELNSCEPRETEEGLKPIIHLAAEQLKRTSIVLIKALSFYTAAALLRENRDLKMQFAELFAN